MADELLHALGNRHAQPPRAPEDPAVGSSEANDLVRPFEGKERDDLLDAMLDSLDRAPRAEPEAEPPPPPVEPAAELEPPTAGPEAEPAPPPVDLASRRRSTFAWVSVATALAAAVLLWLGLRRSPLPSDEGLPPYAATRLDGGSATMRSGATEPPSSISLAPTATIDWVLTPRAPVRTAVGAVLLAERPGQPAQLVRLDALTVSAEGVVRITGPLSEVLPLPPDTWSVTILLGAPASLPTTAHEAEASEGRPWSRVAFEVKIIAAP